jgi:hypothetical protein
MWFEGYWWWVCPNGGQSVSPQKFALWQVTGAASGTLVPTSATTSGDLRSGWNWVPLAAPIPLAIATTYNACTGFSGPFPDSDASDAGTGAADSYGPDGHVSGITSGPLFAFSDGSGTAPEPWANPNGVFDVASTDPSLNMPARGSNSGNFWMDLQVTDQDPAGYSGSRRLWPTKWDADIYTSPDTAVNYDVGNVFALSEQCAVNRIWYYSPSGTTQLATQASIWRVSDQAQLVSIASPHWSGAPGSGWVSCDAPPGTTLPADRYIVSVYNGAASPDSWSAKRLGYWGNYGGRWLPAPSGITNGPLSAPSTSSAPIMYEYNGSNPGAIPPFSDGVTEPGQSVFSQGPPDRCPYLYVTGLYQNYWVDVEVTPPVTASSPTPSSAAPSTTAPTAKNPGAFLTFFP